MHALRCASHPDRPLWVLPTLACLWLLARPYFGVWHDGVLYMAQVLKHTRAPQLALDAFFAGGSQDSYSLYSVLIAPLYASLGMSVTHQTLLLLSWALTASGVLAVARRMYPDTMPAWWGGAAVATLSSIYGGGWVFSYTEPYVTARTLAEPALVWALAAWLDRRNGIAAALLLFGALTHPLMCAPVLVVAWLALVQRNRRWLALLLLAPALLAPALLGLPPLDGLLQRYDDAWWNQIVEANSQVLLSMWKGRDVTTLVTDLALVSFAALAPQPSTATRQLLRAVLGASATLFVVSALGVDGLHNRLLTQLQLWRVHWVLHLFAQLLTPWLIAALWSRGALWRLAALGWALLQVDSHLGSSLGLYLLPGVLLVMALAQRQVAVSTAVIRVAITGLGLGVLGLTAAQMHTIWELGRWQQHLPLVHFTETLRPSLPLCAAALLWLGARPRRSHITGQQGVVAALAATATLVACLTQWDQRDNLALAVENPPVSARALTAHIPPQASVLWVDHLAATWSVLERPSHYSRAQGAGLLFNRATSEMLAPRRAQYLPMLKDQKACVNSAHFSQDLAQLERCDQPAQQRLTTLCQAGDHPDYVVLPAPLSAPAQAYWTLLGDRGPTQTFHLYACDTLAAGNHKTL